VPLVWKSRAAPEDGDYCIAEIDDDRIARLVEVLGADDRPEWDDHAVASQYRLRVHFPPEVVAEAARLHPPTAAEIRHRTDLRDHLVFTIDPEDARDHDDALSWRALGHGVHEVGIHIADVSHYVTSDSALDAEAQLRGTSCYLPGGVIPMLPEALSADLCSLRPDQDRLALSVFAELDERGALKSYRFEETVIRSRHRLHYGQVQAAIDGRQPFDRDLQSALEALLRLSRQLRARRWKNGALDLDVPETKAWVDAHGVPVRIERREHLESHELIEEFMLLANRCVGAEGARRKAGVLFRVHEPPSPTRLAEMDLQLKALGLPRPGPLDDPAHALQALLRVPLDPPRRREHGEGVPVLRDSLEADEQRLYCFDSANAWAILSAISLVMPLAMFAVTATTSPRSGNVMNDVVPPLKLRLAWWTIRVGCPATVTSSTIHPRPYSVSFPDVSTCGV